MEFTTQLALSEKAAELINQSQKYELQVKEISIDNADQRANAVNLGIELNKHGKLIEAERVKQTKPILDAKGQIDDLYKPYISACETMVTQLKKAVGSYDTIERKKAEELQAKLRAEAEEAARKERERLAKLAEKQIDKGQEEKAEETIQKIEQVQVFTPIVTAPVVKQKGESVAKVKKARIVDESLIPRMYLMVDEKKINGVIKMLGFDANIPGVEVYEEEEQRWGGRG